MRASMTLTKRLRKTKPPGTKTQNTKAPGTKGPRQQRPNASEYTNLLWWGVSRALSNIF